MIECQQLSIDTGAGGTGAVDPERFLLSDVSFTVPTGAYGVLMGRTGSGKTTLLEAICGLRKLMQGTIRLAGRDVTRLHPAARGIGYVPQDGALFPRMTAGQNLNFALAITGIDPETLRCFSGCTQHSALKEN